MTARESSSPSQVSDEPIRRKALKLLDDANITSAHIRVCLVASAGFFTDGYALCALRFALPSLALAYDLDESVYAMMICSIWLGALFGNVMFGYMTDRYGRKKMFGIELVIVIIGSVISAICGQGHTLSFVGAFVFCRFILGIGIGGDYPISALIITELAPKKFRGTMLAAGFAVYTLGALFAGIVSIIALVAFRESVNQDSQNLDRVWRITIGFGALPAIIALYFRMSIPETPRYLIDVEGDFDFAQEIESGKIQIGNYEYQRKSTPTQNPSGLGDIYRHFWSTKSGKYLVLMSFIWFCTSLYSLEYTGFPIVINIEGSGVYNTLLESNLNYLFWRFLGYVPGVLLTVCLIDRYGRKPILYFGFIACAVLYVVLGLLAKFAHIVNPQNIYYTVSIVYLFFLMAGPRAMAFVLSAELFTTRYRSTAYGISASFGKISFILFFIISQWTVQPTMHLVICIVCAIFMLFGVAATALLPETNNKSLEEIAER